MKRPSPPNVWLLGAITGALVAVLAFIVAGMLALSGNPLTGGGWLILGSLVLASGLATTLEEHMREKM